MRELTADTIIRVRKPLPLPRKRELTGDTRIRLSQIKDLKDWALEMAQDEAAPEGTVHHWSDGDHVKKNGKWVPVKGSNNAKEARMATNGKAPKESLTRKYFDEHYNGKVPKTKKEIKQFIKDTGAVLYDPKSKNGMSQFTKKGLEEMERVTGGHFDTVVFVSNPEVIEEDTIAQIVRGIPGFLMINHKNRYWEDETYRNEVLAEYTSTDSIFHPFFHEDAHKDLIPTKDEWDEGDRERAGATSLIAKTSPEEFMAEFKAKKKYLDKNPNKGIITKDEIDLFRKYGGVYEDL